MEAPGRALCPPQSRTAIRRQKVVNPSVDMPISEHYLGRDNMSYPLNYDSPRSRLFRLVAEFDRAKRVNRIGASLNGLSSLVIGSAIKHVLMTVKKPYWLLMSAKISHNR